MTEQKARLMAIKKMTHKVWDKIMKIGLKTGCGHIASAMSVTEVLCATYIDSPNAIIILSKGHGALAQYVILNMLGKLSDKRLSSYYQDGGLSGHATLSPSEGIYASTGSLGHGLPIGIGYALANPDKKVVVIMSDGETQEGSTLESLQIIRRLQIKNIVPVVDMNGWAGFQNIEEAQIPYNVVKFYSIKGRFWGDKEDTLLSHYTKVDKELYKLYKESRGINRRSMGSK
jgi:transketolase